MLRSNVYEEINYRCWWRKPQTAIPGGIKKHGVWKLYDMGNNMQILGR